MKIKKLFVTLLMFALLFGFDNSKIVNANGSVGEYSWTISEGSGSAAGTYTIRITGAGNTKTWSRITCSDAKGQVIPSDVETPRALKLAYQGALNDIANNYCSSGGGCTIQNSIGWHRIGTLTGGSGVLGRFDGNNFCIEPNVMFDDSHCSSYSNSVWSGGNMTIAKILGAYMSGSQDNAHYAAAQLMLWEQMGVYVSTDVAGYWEAREDIYARMNSNNGVTTTYSVSLNSHTAILSVGESLEVSDTTNNLANKSNKYTISSSEGLTATKNGNTITTTLNEPYPKAKAVTISGADDESTGSEVYSISSLISSTSQNLITIGSYVNNVRINSYEGDRLAINTAVGSLVITKKDNLGNVVTTPTTFEIYLAENSPYIGTNADAGVGAFVKHLYQTEDGRTFFTTDANGKITLENELPEGSYYLKETTVSGNYKIKKEALPFIIARDTTTSIDFVNDLLGSVEITKVDNHGNQGGAGNVFEIYLGEGNPYLNSDHDAGRGTYYDHLFVTSEGVSQFTTDRNGKITIANEFIDGDYILKEVSTVDEYLLNSEDIAFTITCPNTTEIEFVNTLLGSLKIVKVDEYGNVASANNTFEIYFADDNPFIGSSLDAGQGTYGAHLYQTKTGETQFVTGDDGAIVLTNALPDGSYILKEVSATGQYDLNTIEVPFSIVGGQQSQLVFTNNLRTVSSTIYKNDIDEPYRCLDEAEFTVYDVTNIYKEGDEQTTSRSNFLKVGKSINLRDYLENTYPGLKAEIEGYPVILLLDNDFGTINTDNTFTANKTGLARVTVIGGAYKDLYVKFLNGKNAYLENTFNPYDLIIYTDKEGENELEIDEIIATSTVDTSTLGTYSVIYEITTKQGVKYLINRKVEVLVDNRPVYDAESNTFKDPITGEVVEDPSVINNREIYELFKAKDNELPEDFINNNFGVYEILIVNDDETLSPLDVFAYEGVLMFKGKTGHTYIQLVDKENHNIPLNSKEVTLYFDKQCANPFGTYRTNVGGVIDFGKDYPVDSLTAINHEVLNVESIDYDVLIKPAFERNISLNEEDYLAGLDELWDKISSFDSSMHIYVLRAKSGNMLFTDKATLENSDFYNANLNGELIEFSVLVYRIYNELDYEAGTLYYKIDDVIYPCEFIVCSKGKLKVPYLKHSRNYMIVETRLPEGYEYINGENPVFTMATDYEDGVDNKETTISNKIRIFDIVMNKTNEQGILSLNGAVFDIYTSFEEGQDFNEIKGIKPETAFSKQETEYINELVHEIVDESDLAGYEDYLEDENFILVDENGDEYGSDAYKESHTTLDAEEKEVLTIVGKLYKVYKPDTIERKYLGRYITGGIYLTLTEALNGATVSVYSDEIKTNKVATYKLGQDKKLVISGLPDGFYWYKLDRPLKDTYEEFIYTAPEGYHVDNDKDSPTYHKAISGLDPTDVIDATKEANPPTDEDYVALSDLPACYGETYKQYISKGTITVPGITYGQEVIFEEISAPNGYLVDTHSTSQTAIAPYGQNKIGFFVKNKAAMVFATGVYIGE